MIDLCIDHAGLIWGLLGILFREQGLDRPMLDCRDPTAGTSSYNIELCQYAGSGIA